MTGLLSIEPHIGISDVLSGLKSYRSNSEASETLGRLLA